MKVKNFYNKNQFLIEEGGKKVFQSYNSTIAIVENDKITLGVDWDYSRTTSKHLYLFLEEYTNINFYGVANKRKYIKKLIEENKIIYDKNLV